MINKLKTKLSVPAVLLIGGFLLFSFISFRVLAVQAATSTVRGLAWWGDTYQYVSFNCLDDTIGDLLDVSGNLELFHFYSAPCTNLVHGVYIDSLSNFSGKAWNNTKGYISFDYDGADPPDGYGFNSNCPNTCNPSTNCWACYLESEQKVYGWARATNDGTWIKLSNATSSPVLLQSWDTSVSVLPGHDIEAGDFVGYATSTIGDMSFNCESEGGGAGNCAVRDYKVYISNLQIGNLSAPNWSYSQACVSAARAGVLRWYKKSGQQTGYEIVINNSDSLSTSTAVCWSGKKTSSIANQYILPNADPDCGALAYNTNYYWWIRLYDEYDEPTEWYQYDHNSATDTDIDVDINSKTFTTFKHDLPKVLFTWDPIDVLVGTTTEFTSTSGFYTTGSPAVDQPCVTGNCAYLWSNTDGDSIMSTTTEATTSVIFFQATGTTVTLQVTDADNYTCSTSTQLSINYALPIWREVRAE